jgi:pimeloyl-ACP methyl ester carboxylesterase
MDKKTTHRNQGKNDNSVLLWLGIGGILLLAIVVVGFSVLQRITVLRDKNTNSVSPTVVPAANSTPVDKPLESYAPTIENGPCQFQSPEQVQVTCGFMIIPEDRTGDITDTVRVAFAIFHSTSSAPQPDPILYLQGGPGGKAIDWSLDAYTDVVAPLLTERDFIVFDPRGVGYSQPSLECSEFKTTYLQDIEGKIPDDQKASYYEGALLSCKNRLLQTGVNLPAYTSADIAADAKDLLVTLGYRQANLYGISYGTRIGQLIMRDSPEVVRSAILDSVVPVETQLMDSAATDWDAALQVLFSQCQSDPDCSSTYPELEKTYNEVVDQLDRQPITITVPIDQNRTIEEVVDGSTFRDTLLWALRNPQTIALAPLLIHRTRSADYSILRFSLAYPLIAFDSISAGLYISVNCHDQVFAMSTEKLDDAIFAMCKLWEARPLTKGENNPVSSEIQTLIFAGKFDPVTPPAFAHQLAVHLTHSTIVEITGQGHAPSSTGASDCPIKLISSFLQDPNVSPDLTCANEAEALKFIVPFNSNTLLTLELTRLDQYKVSTSIPTEWKESEFGFFNRSAWLGDLTQIGVQRAAVSESDWVAWLASNFGGNQGLDQPAIRVEQRQASGLAWSMYRTSSKGNPVDIAFAKSGNETLLVLMISYPDEHDALYDAVFLPVLDSTRSTK